MGQILFAGGGGGAVGSDDLTATASQVLQGQTYMGNDTDDDIGTGTMPNIAAIDDGPSLAVSGDNLYCRMNNGAHIQNASSGYPEVSYNLATVRSAINYTDSSKVLNDTTICGMTGSMPSHSSGQHANSNGVNSSGIWMYIPYGYYISEGNNQTWVYRTKDEMKATVISAYGIASVTNFSVAQYSSQKLLFTWANPSWGMWSGIRIVGKQGGYPSNVGDGTVICDSAAGSYVSGTLATGTWYFRAWNYVTVSGGRWYGGYSQASCYNNVVSGSATFTGSASWTVPTAVRSITVFLVGGGGGTYNSGVKGNRCAGGAGGGYTTTTTISVAPGQTLAVNVGGGGTYQGGTSSVYRNGSCLASVAGGYGNGSVDTKTGCNGGSGGGGGQGTVSDKQTAYAGTGGTDGGNGNSGYIHSQLTKVDGNYISGGTGQGYSTKAWGNSGTPYSPGGGGAKYEADYCRSGTRGAGLTGNNSGAGANGVGRSKWDDTESAYWNYGNSGIVMFKWG